jgi:large subunit ribosomal protein L34
VLTKDKHAQKPLLTQENKYISLLESMSKTYNPRKRKRAKTHGFLTRTKTSTGRRILANKRRKGRKKLSV